MWLTKYAYDYFFGVGLIVVALGIFTVVFKNGELSNFSTAWILFPPSIYAWLRGELHHWPKERTQ